MERRGQTSRDKIERRGQASHGKMETRGQTSRDKWKDVDRHHETKWKEVDKHPCSNSTHQCFRFKRYCHRGQHDSLLSVKVHNE
jgi:hypothetical protein